MERPKKVRPTTNNIRFSIESSTSGEGSSSSTSSDENNINNDNESDCTINNNETINGEKPTFESIYKSIPNEILEKIGECKVKYAFITKGTMMSTSKQHKFKQPTSLNSAIQFLADTAANDSTLVFTNENSLIFSNNLYLEYDEFNDSD